MAQTGLEPNGFRWLCKHSTTELQSQQVNSLRTFHLKPILVTSRPFLLVLGCLQLLKLRKAILPLSYITRLQVLVAGQTDLPISTVCMTFQLDGRSKRLTNIHSLHDLPIGKTYQYPQSAWPSHWMAGQKDLPISTVCMTFPLDGRSKRLTNIHSLHDLPIGWQVKKTY